MPSSKCEGRYRLCYDSCMGAKSLKTKIDDPVVRAKLIEGITVSDRGSLIIEEFSVAKGRARADVIAVRNNKVHAYEIKSDVDNLSRLPSQQKYYSSLFNTVTLVVGMEHIVKAMYLIPDWWGVMVAVSAPSGIELVTIREAKDNTNISPTSISEVMRNEEIVSVLRQHAPGKSYSSLNRSSLLREVKGHIDDKHLLREFPRMMFERNKTRLVQV